MCIHFNPNTMATYFTRKQMEKTNGAGCRGGPVAGSAPGVRKHCSPRSCGPGYPTIHPRSALIRSLGSIESTVDFEEFQCQVSFFLLRVVTHFDHTYPNMMASLASHAGVLPLSQWPQRTIVFNFFVSLGSPFSSFAGSSHLLSGWKLWLVSPSVDM